MIYSIVNHTLRIASKLYEEVRNSLNTGKIVVFLGGSCVSEDWRNSIKKEFPDIQFLDPYDKNWDPADNIYDELAGMLLADNVVFFMGGDGTAKEKKFLKLMDREYASFEDIGELKIYLKNISKPIKE